MSRMGMAGHVGRLAMRTVLSLACVVGVASPAGAAVFYDFSLPANGSVGAVNVALEFFDFILPSGLITADLTEPIVVRASSGTPVDPSSAVGFEVTGSSTLFGLAFFAPGSGDIVLLTTGHPQDFFVFERAPRQTGTFFSTSGLLEDSDGLATRTPTAMLVVSVVPEPATLALVGVAGVVLLARKKGGWLTCAR